MRMKSKPIHRATIAKGLQVIVLMAIVAQVACDVMICNYEKFDLYDSSYQKKTDDFCVFKDVFLQSDVRYMDFMANSLDYRKVAFINSKFPFVPPSLYRNFDDVRELYVRRCMIDTLRITRLIEKMYAGYNQITSILIDGNGSNNLRELYLETNSIGDISNLTNLPNMEVLVLENNPRIGNTDFAMFSRMVNLWKLDLENTGMTKIINSLKLNLNELVRLDLSNNQLSYIDMQLFQTFPHLEHLWLNGNRIYYMEFEPIRTFVPDIRSIVIDDNYWGCQHLAIVSKYFLENGVIIRTGECKTRAVHKVCCADTTALIDNRYIIEMNIKTQNRFNREIESLEKSNFQLQQIVESMRTQLNSLILNYTITMVGNKDSPIQDDSSPALSESVEDYSYENDEEERHGHAAFQQDATTEESSEEQSATDNVAQSERNSID
ncbi:uncharacterized protein LOC131436083 [Malaya genurostris]|uniref:uncharacterized protein LOC131436083 n=1 Tax=Malaya genurostris TaxID=325434 RepID=UPI0026F3955A|nr:uncharacterized protein LOC131436083 [Malaya genurostris]XP_058460532.1 uncharacterized protein LOC131436083 [Malaya genurostris]